MRKALWPTQCGRMSLDHNVEPRYGASAGSKAALFRRSICRPMGTLIIDLRKSQERPCRTFAEPPRPDTDTARYEIDNVKSSRPRGSCTGEVCRTRLGEFRRGHIWRAERRGERRRARRAGRSGSHRTRGGRRPDGSAPGARGLIRANLAAGSPRWGSDGAVS